jgi:solute carrier family 66, member 2
MFAEAVAYIGYLFNLVLPIGMVVGPVCGYIPQYFLLKRTMSVGSFSPLVCYILIASMYTRCLYWYWNRFELPLFFQAVVMLITMIGILQVVMQITRESINEHNSAIIRSGNTVLYYFIPAITLLFLLNFAVLSDFITDVLGIVALVIEACLPVPQCYSNYERKSTRGLSMFMVYTWMAGDSFKTFYYAYRDVPTYFLVCGCFQLSVDLLILYQCVCAYAGRVTVSGPHDSDEEEIQTIMKYGGSGNSSGSGAGPRYAPVSVSDPDSSGYPALGRVKSTDGIAMVASGAAGGQKKPPGTYSPPAAPPRRELT